VRWVVVATLQVYPFLFEDKLAGEKPNLEVIAVEPSACPTLTKGEYRYDYGDTARLTPLIKMHALGHDFVPPPFMREV
jgi:tryptophan synthase beta chain